MLLYIGNDERCNTVNVKRKGASYIYVLALESRGKWRDEWII